jgi:4-hydroxy-tetrahydrodipicolinate synthase
VISVASNVIPAEVTALAHAALDGDFAEARRLHYRLYSFFSALFVETNPIPVKAALAALGRIAEEYRLPLCELQPGNREVLLKAMRQAGITV